MYVFIHTHILIVIHVFSVNKEICYHVREESNLTVCTVQHTNLNITVSFPQKLEEAERKSQHQLENLEREQIFKAATGTAAGSSRDGTVIRMDWINYFFRSF